MGKDVSTGILYGHKREPVIKSLERHVDTVEVLVALEGDSAILFAKPSYEFEEGYENFKAFYLRQGDAFAMHRGTWHWIAVPISGDICKFLVMFASGTETNDIEVRNLSEPIKIVY